MNETDLLQRIMWLIPLVLSLTVHEWAHAYSAFKLGDDTASREGRLTLNPVPHIDPIGTILLPLLGVPFGWAKPVPVNPARFDRNVNMGTGTMITAAAGPLSNIFLAALCVLSLGAFARFAPELLEKHRAISMLLMSGWQLNVVLAIFNMLPVPPLDGSRVAEELMPYRLRPAWERFAALGPMVLLAIILMPSLLHFSLLSWPMQQANTLAAAVLRAIVTL